MPTPAPDDRDQLAARPAARPLPCLGERSQLPLAPDQRRVEAPFRRRLDTATSRHAGTGSRLPFSVERLDRLRLDRVSSQAQRRLAEQGLTGLRGLLQPRGDVDGVTRREPLLGARDHLAAADADPPLDAELGQGQLHLRRRLERAHGIVLVHGRQPEDRHHGVADELLDDAAVALDDRLHPLEVAREQGAKRLRVERLAERRRADDVAEQHGHDLALHGCSLGLCFTSSVSADQERSVRGAVHIHREWLCDHFGGYEPCFDERSTWESWRM